MSSKHNKGLTSGYESNTLYLDDMKSLGIRMKQKHLTAKYYYQPRKKPKQMVSKWDKEPVKNAFKFPSNPTAKTWVNTFNNYAQYIKNYEYHSKNQNIFTWHQSCQHLKKVQLPEFKPLPPPDQLAQAYERLNSDFIMPNLSDIMNPNKMTPLLLPKSQSTGNLDQNKEKKPVMPVKQNKYLKKLKLKMKQKMMRKAALKLINPKATARTTQASQRSIDSRKYDIPPVKLSDYDFKTNYEPRRTYSLSKLQMEKMSRGSIAIKTSQDKINNEEYMQNHFDRRNFYVNRIICQIKPNERQLDKEEIKNDAMKKIDEAIGPFKLHKEIVTKGSPKKSAKQTTRPKTDPKNAKDAQESRASLQIESKPKSEPNSNQNIKNLNKTSAITLSKLPGIGQRNNEVNKSLETIFPNGNENTVNPTFTDLLLSTRKLNGAMYSMKNSKDIQRYMVK